MFPKLPALSAILLSPILVWNRSPNHVHAFVLDVAVDHADCRRRRFKGNIIRRGTELHPHRFNGGYDAASPLTWTPQEAAEFTIFHKGTHHHAGMQLKNTIQHWGGADLAEFLTRLYLAHLVDDATKDGDVLRRGKKVVYEPQNVRNPQWEGLDTREGVLALKDLLKESLSKDSLSAQEISRFAEAFLIKDYRWPLQISKSNTTSTIASLSNSTSRKIVFENDSFYSLGHSRTIARVLLAVRKERGYDEFSSNDIALMVTLPEWRDEDREKTPMQMIDFFRTISAYTSLTATDKANIVQRMAMSGWLSGSIPKFMAELLPEEKLSENHSVDEIWKLQGDAFLDFPTAATVVPETNAKKEKNETSAIDHAVAKVAKVIGKKRRPPSTKKTFTSTTKDTVGSEYDELVQSYWKNVEVATPSKKKQPVKAYGVPKTKSAKKRKIPDKIAIVDSIKT